MVIPYTQEGSSSKVRAQGSSAKGKAPREARAWVGRHSWPVGRVSDEAELQQPKREPWRRQGPTEVRQLEWPGRLLEEYVGETSEMLEALGKLKSE